MESLNGDGTGLNSLYIFYYKYRVVHDTLGRVSDARQSSQKLRKETDQYSFFLRTYIIQT